MPTSASSRLQKCFVQVESSWGVIPNSGGTATVGNNNACLIVGLQLGNPFPIISRPDKTGGFGEIIGIGGRKAGTWSASMSAAANGAAGVVPDCSPFLQAWFGKAPTVVGGTSVTYGLDDLNPSLSIYNFIGPTSAPNLTSQVTFGAICNQLRFALGGDVPTLDFSGESFWTYDNDQAADGATDTAAKGGLSAFPTQPSAPVTNGTHPPGFKGSVTLGGVSFSTLRTMSGTLAVARALPKDVYGNSYPSSPATGLRTVGFDFSMYDDDSSALRTIKQNSFDKTPITVVFVNGTVAGNIWTWTLSNCLLPTPVQDYSGERRILNFSGCKAYESSPGAKDSVALAIT